MDALAKVILSTLPDTDEDTRQAVLTLADARRDEQRWLALRLDLRLCYGPITESYNQVTQLRNSGLYLNVFEQLLRLC